MEGPSNNRRAASHLLARNIAYVTGSSLLLNACTFVGNWALIALYGSAEHGQIVWVVAAARIGMLLGDLGLANKAGVRTIARQRAAEPEKLSETVSDLVTILLAIGAVLAAGMIIFAGQIARLRPGIDPLTLRLAGTWVFTAAVVRISTMLFVGFERMVNLLITSPAASVGKLVWVAACWVCGLPVMWVFIGWTGAHLLAMLIGIWRASGLMRKIGVRIRPRLRGILRSPRIVGAALPYYFPFLGLLGLPFAAQLAIGSARLDAVGAGQVSIFQVCFALSQISRLLASPISSVLFPRVAHVDASADADHSQTAAAVQRAARMLGLLGTLVFAAHWAVGPHVLGLLYGDRYAAALPTLLLLAFAVGIENYSMQLDQVLMATRSVRVVAWLEALRYAILVGIWWWSIPAYGPFGAAAAIAVAAAVGVACKMIAARRQIAGIGAISFASTLGTFAVSAGAGLLPLGAYLVLPAWLAAALALRLLRPREIVQWGRVLAAALAGRKEADTTQQHPGRP